MTTSPECIEPNAAGIDMEVFHTSQQSHPAETKNASKNSAWLKKCG